MPEPSHPDAKTSSQSTRVVVDAVNYRQIFSWLRLFDLFWISVDMQKLLLAATAVLIFAGGIWCIDLLPFAPALDALADSAEAPLRNGVSSWTQIPPAELIPNQATTSWQLCFTPAEPVIRPLQVLFQSESTWPQLARAWTQLLWALAVWSLFGGAITRIAAVQIGADSKVNLLNAIQFSGRRFLSYFSAPLIPLAGIGVLWGLCLLGGLIGRIPAAGPWIIGLVWGVILLCGLLMALMLIGVVAGWPLMMTTISVEGSDSLDGLSRSFGFVFTKPWQYLFLLGAAALLGAVYSGVIVVLAYLSSYLADWGIGWGMGTSDPHDNPLTRFWISVLATFVLAYIHSYFWSATTMIYFVLRRSVDGNDFGDVFLEGQPHDDLLILEQETAAS